MSKKVDHINFLKAIKQDIVENKKHNKRSIEKMGLEYGIVNKNDIKELVESAIVQIAREIANQPNKSIKQRYNEIVQLYEGQVNLSHRTSQSMLLQQYSTPATIAFLLGMYVGIDNDQGRYYEPSAGNGMLTIASDGKNIVVNEIDDFRNNNLKTQNTYLEVTKKDGSVRQNHHYIFDGIITNPPFGKLDKEEYFSTQDGFKLTQLDHVMASIALNTMKDDGRAGIIIGGHNEYDSKGRIKAGKNRQFLSYLYRNYNVDDIINISGKDLYSKMGTAFNTRVILINGRKKKPGGYPPLKSQANTEPVKTYEQLYDRFSPYFKTTKKMDLLKRAQLIRERQKKLSEGLAMPYIPASEACFTLEVDTPDSMSYEIHAAIKKVKEQVGGSLNSYVQERLNYKSDGELCGALAAEQIDGVALSIWNIEEKNQGLIIGDQTGIGKGRQAASIIRYAVENNYPAIFLTEKPNLFSDLYRDLEDIGSSHYVPFIVNAKASKTNIKNKDGVVKHTAPPKTTQESIFKKGSIPKEYDFVVATYSQFASSKPTVKQSWLSRVSKGAIIIMDESHNASGASATGEFLKSVVSKSKSTIFLSATFAKRPDNMPIYALKTAIQDANMGEEDLVNAISSGGVALQEILSSQLVSEGQMIRRERTYEGIEVNYLTLDKLENEHRKIADGITDIIRDIISFQSNFVDDLIDEKDSIAVAEMKEVEARQGTKNAGVDNTPYFSKVFNVINQMLFSIKAESVAELAIKRLEQDKKPVIAFANTMGAFVDDFNEGDVISADFKEVLVRGLESVLKYTEIDANGQREHKMLELSEMDQDGQSKYMAILNKIENISTGIGVSPIDLIVKRINEAGFTTAEVTGRKKEVQLSFGKNGDITGLILNRKKENTVDAFRKFNDNEVDVLLINQSGSTGASAHAVATKKVPKEKVLQRVMIVLQAELNINTEIQKRGRINRTGQLIKPQYDYVSSAIPAEKRLQMMLQKKLKSLDANTTSNQKNSEDLMKSDDFLNKYGDEVVRSWLIENPEMNRVLGGLIDDEKDDVTNLAHKTSGRVAILPAKEQDMFYKTIIKQYQDRVKILIDKGEYDLEVEDMNLEAKTIEKKVSVVGKNSNSLFGGNTYLEKCEVNNLKKPLKYSEIQDKIDKSLKGMDADEYQASMVEAYEQYAASKSADMYVEKKLKWEKVKNSIRKEKKYISAQDKEAYYQSRLQEIEVAMQKDINAAERKIRGESDMILRFIKFFKVGRALYAPFVTYDQGKSNSPAICVGASIDEGATNPFAPSNISFTIATADSRRQLDLKSSSMFIGDIQAIIGASYYLREYQQNEILNNWDELSRESSVNRVNRYIVTGNILQGYGKYNKGKLVSYTLEGGGVAKGILMPMSYSPKDSSNRDDQYVNVPIGLITKFVKSTISGGTIRTTSALQLQRGTGQTKIYLPSSRKQGGKFYLDENVLELVLNNNFDKIGTNMIGYVNDDHLDQFLKLLQEKFGVSAMVPSNRIDDIEGVKQQIEKSSKVEEKGPSRSRAKVLKLKAKAALIKQKQLLIKYKTAV